MSDEKLIPVKGLYDPINKKFYVGGKEAEAAFPTLVELTNVPAAEAATADSIAIGKKAWVNGVLITGTA